MPPISDPVMRRIAHGLKTLSDEDRNAMYAFLTDKTYTPPDIGASTEAVCKESTPAAALSGDNAGLAQQADAFIGKYCRNCHGPGESSQGSYPAGDLSSIAANAAFVTPGDGVINTLADSIEESGLTLTEEAITRALAQADDFAVSRAELRVAIRVLAHAATEAVHVARLRGERLNMGADG